MGLWRRAGLFGGIGSRRDRETIEHAIAAVGLTGFEERAIGTLSGGQMQRTLFARLLLQDARVIVLDEPFTAIDTKTAADLFDLVMRWHGEKRTVVAALHDLDLVRAMFPEALLLAREPVAWGDTPSVLTAGKSAQGAPHVRGVRRARAANALTRRRDGMYDYPHRAVRRIRVHAPRAGRHARARARRGPVGVFLMLRRMSLVGDAMAHAILPGAAVGFLLSGLILFAMTAGGLIAGLRRRGRRRRGRARDRAQGGRLARGVLPDLARARRHHRVAQGHQRRSPARPVRHGAGARRSDPAADRCASRPIASSCWR